MIKNLEPLKQFARRIGLSDALLRTVYNATYGQLKRKTAGSKIQHEFWAILAEISRISDKAQAPIWPTFGTLLGLHRDKGPISHDDDIDFGAWYLDHAAIHAHLTQAGFSLVKTYTSQAQNVPVLEEAYEFRGVQLDVFYFHNREDMSFTHDFLRDGKNSEYDHSTKQLSKLIVREIHFPRFEVIRLPINDIEVYFPNDVTSHLAARYGDHFMTPDPTWVARETNDKVVSYDGIMGLK